MAATGMNRSTSETVRNPLLALESAREIASLPPEAREALRKLLLEVSADARARAEKCWRTHKAPMAVYWKTWAVNARHAARLCRAPEEDCHGRRGARFPSLALVATR
jgi:hypothetical protein